MTIKRMAERLMKSDRPTAAVLSKGTDFKVLVIGFRSGMVLEKHTTKVPAKLIVLEGAVRYVDENQYVELKTYDEKEIPVNVIHEVRADVDSVCLLIQG